MLLSRLNYSLQNSLLCKHLGRIGHRDLLMGDLGGGSEASAMWQLTCWCHFSAGSPIGWGYRYTVA